MPQVAPAIETFARIKVVGVGGAGGAAINRMVEAGIDGVEFIAINTDAQALHHSLATIKIHIGKDATRGLGAGADPSVGEQAARESADEIRQALEGADMVFITLGAGGGTGSGAGHVVAELGKETGALVVGFATKPFAFEGQKRAKNATLAIDNLRTVVDTLIIIPNDRLLQTIDRQTPLLEAFKVADDVLRQGVQGISDLITVHGLINLDFADVKAVMSSAGSALMGIGRASGEDRAIKAAQQAIESPLLEVSIDGARGILFNVIGGNDLSMHEINTAAETITSAADPEANIIFGATINPELDGELIVTVVATGFDAAYFSAKPPVQVGAAGASSTADASTGDMSDIDVSLDSPEKQPENDFTHDDKSAPNIWAIDEQQDANASTHETAGEQATQTAHEDTEDKVASFFGSHPIVGGDEDELDKPSFLRRLTRFTNKDEHKDDQGK